ncbi:MAG: hypothetical protein AB8B56_07400 [Crocinitomicaceae bacterium]
MKFLKPFIIGSFACLTLSLNAQTSSVDAAIDQLSTSRIDLLTTELSLTNEQVAQIDALNQKVIQKIETIRDDAQMNDSKKREFVRGNQADHKRVMSTILTPEQFTAYEDLMKPKASHRTEKRTQLQDIKKTK